MAACLSLCSLQNTHLFFIFLFLYLYIYLYLYLAPQDRFPLPPHCLLHQELIVDHRLESLAVKFLRVLMFYIALEEKGVNLGLLAGWFGS